MVSYSIGDVNGDGIDDILIGACGDDDGGTHAGQIYLLLGSGLPRAAGAAGWETCPAKKLRVFLP